MLVLQAVCYFVFPFISKLPEMNDSWLFCILYSLSVICYIVRTIAFNEIFVLIANCSYQEFRAKTFSLVSVMGGIGRFIVGGKSEVRNRDRLCFPRCLPGVSRKHDPIHLIIVLV